MQPLSFSRHHLLDCYLSPFRILTSMAEFELKGRRSTPTAFLFPGQVCPIYFTRKLRFFEKEERAWAKPSLQQQPQTGF